MGNLSFRSSETPWKGGEVKLFGRTITGITGWELTKEVEKEPLYGAGNKPLDIMTGNEKCSGSVTVFGYELDRMQKAAAAAGFTDLLEVPHEATEMTVTLRKTLAERPTVIKARGLAFTKIPHKMGQNDTNREYQLDFVCMDIRSETL